MITLDDIRDYVAGLGIAEDSHCYCGKMPEKKEKSIGSYPLKSRPPNQIPIGGMKNTSYTTKAISFLVHWNKIPSESEQAANALQQALQECDNVTINGQTIKFIDIMYAEPVSVDTDENGIYEYVIECLFYLERKE